MYIRKIPITILAATILFFTVIFATANEIQATTQTNIEELQQRIEESERLMEYLLDTVQALHEENDALRERLENAQENMKYLGEFTITYYCVEQHPHICGTGNGITASGAHVTAGVSAAVDTTLIPFGTALYIDGIGVRIAQDRGGAVNGNKIDIAVATHEEALQLGKQKNVAVWVIE